jgi:ribosome biogenesis GTPase
MDQTNETNDALTDEQTALRLLGWKPFFQLQQAEYPEHFQARVVRQDVDRYQLLGAKGPLIGILPGKTRLTTFSKAELPTVGDWVLIRKAEESKNGHLVVIERTLERISKFSRKQAGEVNDEQVLAANIDTVFIVTGLDDNFNLNRIERYLIIAAGSGADPVIVLSKSDLCEDISSHIDQVREIAPSVPIHVVSCVTGDGLEDLRHYLSPGETAALLGSSGVGKSTITNYLLGYERILTGEVRAGDGKGRHTTTYRELCPIEGAGMVIDTPGMREIQIWGEEEAILPSFEDIDNLAINCRFNDCQHNAEPDCAVTQAIKTGELQRDRLQTYRKFQLELAQIAEKENAASRAQKKQARRTFSKTLKKRPTKRK